MSCYRFFERSLDISLYSLSAAALAGAASSTNTVSGAGIRIGSTFDGSTERSSSSYRQRQTGLRGIAFLTAHRPIRAHPWQIRVQSSINLCDYRMRITAI